MVSCGEVVHESGYASCESTNGRSLSTARRGRLDQPASRVLLRMPPPGRFPYWNVENTAISVREFFPGLEPFSRYPRGSPRLRFSPRGTRHKHRQALRLARTSSLGSTRLPTLARHLLSAIVLGHFACGRSWPAGSLSAQNVVLMEVCRDHGKMSGFSVCDYFKRERPRSNQACAPPGRS